MVRVVGVFERGSVGIGRHKCECRHSKCAGIGPGAGTDDHCGADC